MADNKDQNRDRSRDQNQSQGQGQRNQRDVVLDTVWGALHPQLSPWLEKQYDKLAESPFGDEVFHYYLEHKGLVKAAASGLGALLKRYQDPASLFWTHGTDLFADMLGESLVRLDQRADRHGAVGIHAADIVVGAARQAANFLQRIVMLQEPQRTQLVDWLLLDLVYEEQQIVVHLIASFNDAALRRFTKMTDEQKRNTISLFAQEELQAQATQATMVNCLESFGGWLQQSNIELQEQVNRGFFGRRRGRN